MYMQKWIIAFRLRTLPLTLACVSMGSFLAASAGKFKWEVLFLTLLTTLFLQILSNLSNDYGDFIHGADHAGRTGPQRAVQSGEISASSMKIAIYIFVGLSLISGILLLYVSVAFSVKFLIFFLFGIASIAAAIYYTNGKKPYGYSGFGDISVFVFFGILGVFGSYYLHVGILDYIILLPAISCGLFAVAVLNINNIRDLESDEKAGKKSIPVRIGRKNALIYHYCLLIIAMSSSVLFILLNFKSYFQFSFLLVIPLLIKNAKAVKQLKNSLLLDPYLKQMALTTLLFVMLFGLGLIIF